VDVDLDTFFGIARSFRSPMTFVPSVAPKDTHDAFRKKVEVANETAGDV
jgi:hypothetical protein